MADNDMVADATSHLAHHLFDRGLKVPTYSAFRVVGAIVIMVVVMFLTMFIYFEIDHQLERSRTAESDNRTFVLTQIEVDLQRLMIALQAADLDGATDDHIDSVRLAFDILYSRVDLARRAETLNGLPLRQSEGWIALSAERGLIERLLPIMDGDDQELIAELPTMIGQVEHMLPEVRDSVVSSVSATMNEGDAAREDLRQSLYGLMIAEAIIVVVLALLLMTIYLQGQIQRRHAKVLELAVHNLRTTIEASRDAVLIIDGPDKVIGANEAGAEMLGRPVTPDQPVHLSSLITTLGDENGLNCARCEAHMEREDGVVLPVELTVAPARTATGHTFKIAFLRDMSEQLERENRLAEALQAATRGEETKDRFLAVMSHEMRTPLNGLLSAIDLMEGSSKFDAHQTWLMDIIRGCGMATLEQVNNVLELTRLAGRSATDYPAIDFDLVESVQAQLKQFDAFALRRGNTLTLDTTGVRHAMVGAPLPLVRRVLSNLISNAIKFTRDGAIDVVLSTDDGIEAGHCQVTLAVQDSGIGIDAADLERIFKNFETLDSSFSRAQEGSGLGLGIAKLAAEALGGKIRVESEPGRGSCFTVTFPAAIATNEHLSVASVDKPHDVGVMLNILIAEDNDINRMLLERQLVRLGHRVTAVGDGQAAVDAATSSRFDVILMDVSMPKMDGMTACRILRERNLLEGVPIIALTAQAAQDRQQQFIDAGMDEVVTKPANIGMLDQLMQNLVARSGGNATPPAAKSGDEELLDRQMFAEMLEDMGPDFLNTMIGRFQTDIDKTLRDIDAAIAKPDRQAVAQLAHKAAGAAAVLSLSALAEQLRKLENDAESRPTDALQQQRTAVAQLVEQSNLAVRAELAIAA